MDTSKKYKTPSYILKATSDYRNRIKEDPEKYKKYLEYYREKNKARYYNGDSDNVLTSIKKLFQKKPYAYMKTTI